MLSVIFDKFHEYCFVDVRSPSEFKRGHIPGAYNIPLLSDQTRAVVGAMYVQKGKKEAMHYAMQHVGPRFDELVCQAEKVKEKNPKKKMCVYCARGGMRSKSVVWLFNFFKVPANQLEGGYKLFRNWALPQFEVTQQIRLLSGKTGVGKTELLHQFKKEGKQIVDLEGCAQHKGSVFGGDKDKQATQQQFENDLSVQWSQLHHDEQVWLEDESRKIGSIIIPAALWQQMKRAPKTVVEKSLSERRKRIVAEYGSLSPEFLQNALTEIKDHLGDESYRLIAKFIEKRDLERAVDMLLVYYDKKYEHFDD
jgi:tRNA 2-selenouridine synthase